MTQKNPITECLNKHGFTAISFYRDFLKISAGSYRLRVFHLTKDEIDAFKIKEIIRAKKELKKYLASTVSEILEDDVDKYFDKY